MKEGGWVEGTRAAIKDVVVIGLGTREDFYCQSFRMCDPLERPGGGAGSLNGESRD